MDEAQFDAQQMIHVVSTTCTDTVNPAFDYFAAKGLGPSQRIEKVLLHGIGCSSGLAALGTGANLALGHAARARLAKTLCVDPKMGGAIMVRSELDSIHALQETRIGACLFSDCASAVAFSNGIGARSEPVSPLAWNHCILPDTEDVLGFEVDPVGRFLSHCLKDPCPADVDTKANGWKVVMTPRVPALTGTALTPALQDLLASLPSLPRRPTSTGQSTLVAPPVSPMPSAPCWVGNGSTCAPATTGTSTTETPARRPYFSVMGSPVCGRHGRADACRSWSLRARCWLSVWARRSGRDVHADEEPGAEPGSRR